MNTVPLEERVKNERLKDVGVQTAALAVTGVASIGGAYLGSSVGEGIGYIIGQTVDVVPVLRDLTPQLAAHTGLLAHAAHQAQFNVDFYQTIGAGAGLLCGIAVPVLYLVYKWRRLAP